MSDIDLSSEYPFVVYEHAQQYANQILARYRIMADAQIKQSLSSFFREEMGIKGLHPNFFTFSHGSDDALNHIIGVVKNRNLRPVFFTPVPTLGYAPMLAKFNGYNVAYVRKEKDGSVSPEQLAKHFSIVNKGMRYSAIYYDPNPRYPSGRIRDWKATEVLANFFIQYNRSAQKKGHPPIYAIDDMTYWGTGYKEKKCAACFASFPEMLPHTFVLTSTSKWCGKEYPKVGLIISHPDMCEKFKKVAIYPPDPRGLYALEAIFSGDSYHVQSREKYLSEAKAYHQFAAKLLKVLIDGVESIRDHLHQKEEEAMIRLVSDTMEISESEAQRYLLEGTPGLEATPLPESSFFLLANCHRLKGKFFPSHSGASQNLLEIRKGRHVRDLFRGHGVKIQSSRYMGLNGNNWVIRFSFATSHQNIVQAMARIRRVLSDERPAQNSSQSVLLAKGNVPSSEIKSDSRQRNR